LFLKDHEMPFILAVTLQAALIARGDDVEVVFKAQASQLQTFFTSFKAALESDAPSLVSMLESPAKPPKSGYQRIPQIVANTTSLNKARVAAVFSWKSTERRVNDASAKLASSADRLASIRSASIENRLSAYRELLSTYRDLLAEQRVIESQIQYNRFWQKAAVDDPRRFQGNMKLIDAILRGEMPELPAAEFTRPSYLRVEVERGQTVIHLPVYTDISDDAFLKQVKDAVERVWRFDSDGIRVRVDVEFRRRTAVELYGNDPAPRQNAAIDVAQHVKRFPLDGAVLTTGATSTYAIAGRYIALGPTSIVPNAIAHEFGHLLGFVDGYLRGSRSLADHSLEIVELIPDGDDIMSMPGTGHVTRQHFEALLKR
jgi:hypothetical protein